jgi:cellulose 1,4-beta-cellobiosidase
VVSTAAFTTTAAGDTTVPTLGGSIIIGTVTSSSIQTSLSQAGADNVGVTSYEVSSNSGGSWLDVGIPGSLSYTFPGLSASTSYPLWWRAKDAAGNVSTALTATQSTAAASGVGSISLNSAIYTFKTNNGTVIASTGLTFYVHDVSTGALVGSAITGLSTNASGLVTTAISNASMLAGTQYRLDIESSTGKYGSIKLTAV